MSNVWVVDIIISGGIALYKILIVDDERVERTGIRFLIDEYNIELDIAEAENGEKALEHIENNPIDILITDIRMPFMDGLELAARVREIRPNIKIVIMSAYSEFEYAKKAIDLKVVHYILKPIEDNEFVRTINNIINVCNSETDEKENEKKLLDGYQKSLKYEKEKVLMDLISGVEINQLKNSIRDVNINFDGCIIQLALINFESRFFDSNNNEFESLIKIKLGQNFEYINLNEYESVIFLINPNREFNSNIIVDFSEHIKEVVYEKYNMNVFIALSKPINSVEEVREQYVKLEHILESRFFFDGSVILFEDNDYVNIDNPEKAIENIVSNIFEQIGNENLKNLKELLVLLFNCFHGKISFSSIYVKYECSGIVKEVYKKLNKKEDSQFRGLLDDIYKSNSLHQLKDIMLSKLPELIGDDLSKTSDGDRKVIKEVMYLINDNYMKDISVEMIADKVYLSADYLSRLFKECTGQGLMKYITSLRFKKAEELLFNSNMKIVDISEQVGYTNLSYFCMIFRNNYGMSPAKYRERGKQNAKISAILHEPSLQA